MAKVSGVGYYPTGDVKLAQEPYISNPSWNWQQSIANVLEVCDVYILYQNRKQS